MKPNPFRARRLSPGQLPYLFPDGHDIGQLAQRFVSTGLRGQIVGQHGTGKSTLLQSLAAELRKRDCRLLEIALTPNTPRGQSPLRRIRKNFDGLPGEMRDPADRQRVITVDGCEMANWWERFRFFRATRAAGWGVLVTTHRDLGIPTLWETFVTPERARRVIGALIQLEWARSDGSERVGPAPMVPDKLVDELLTRHDGDLREVLFALYDWHRNL